MRLYSFLPVTLLLVASTLACHADTFAGTPTFTDTNPGGQVDFTGAFTSPSFSYTGTSGSFTDQLTITSSTTRNGNASVNELDNLQISLLFTLPDPTSGSISGTGDITGHVNSAMDTITWDNGGMALINFTNGAQLLASIPDFNFSGFTSDSENLTLTVEKVGASAVPEPSTLALFGTGILGLAGMARRKFFNA